MADKNRILVVTQEFHPYTSLSEIAQIAHDYSQGLQENGMEVRILMPRFGAINERRHRLHEVVRLSGMNITVDDEDYPLVIKVASLPGTRMQIYFLDNDDFYKRKNLFEDAQGKPYADNIDRMIFFCKGVIETVKKFGWAPDIVHCHGWMTSLLPAYLKNHYRNEPIFQNARFIYSIYTETKFGPALGDSFRAKALENQLSEEVIDSFFTDNKIDLKRGAARYADGIILSDETASTEQLDAPILPFQPKSEGDWTRCLEFFQTLLMEAEENA